MRQSNVFVMFIVTVTLVACAVRTGMLVPPASGSRDKAPSDQLTKRPDSRNVADADPQAMAKAADLVRASKFREAELVLTREAQRAPLDLQVRNELVLNYTRLAKQALGRSDHPDADSQIAAATAVLRNMEAIAISPDAVVPDNFAELVATRERDVKELRLLLGNAADTKCYSALSEAEKVRREGERWFLKNDRTKVTEGLVLVRTCVDLTSWISVNARAKADKSMDDLLSLVTKKERDSILVAAGMRVSGQT